MAEMFQYARREPLTDRLSYFTRHAGLDPASFQNNSFSLMSLTRSWMLAMPR